ncbi:MAG: site-specific DNA-methyltransferase [Sulfurimonas sp.]|jgi:site-specific DNA-methyltransferase (adenine-specific)
MSVTQVKPNSLIHGDCLQVMKFIEDKSIDMILCDLPYGIVACAWDTIIPLESLWEQYKRIIKKNGVICLTAVQPFTSELVMSNKKWFKYEWIWEKSNGTNFFNCTKMPLRAHENILIFYANSITYNPQKTIGNKYKKKQGRVPEIYSNSIYDKTTTDNTDGSRFPKTILKVNYDNMDKIHPTQKPISLFDYLIKTYTNEKDVVLDNCAGSGTTAIAAIRLNRNYILIEKELTYYELAKKRIEAELRQTTIKF